MARRRVISLVAGGLLSLVAAMVAMSGAALAVTPDVPSSAVPGNNGTVKIQDGVSDSENLDQDNNPHVCTFFLSFSGADANQSGSWWIDQQPPTGSATNVLTGTYLTDGSGNARQPGSGTYTLPNGHYELSWQGTGTTSTEVKHKVFWVACADPSASPTATPTATATPTETATATPTGCLLLSVVGPAAFVTPTPCLTPFESFQGETGTPLLTPPPTNTGSGSSNSSIPLLALLICLAFGGLGIAAVETQRRSVNR